MRYAAGALRGAFNAEDPKFRVLVRRICDKSDGVFLWVSLAVKSIQRGQRDENTLEELIKRLEILPHHLHQLYESMWRRLNDDEPIYRQDGAQLLNYVLVAEDVNIRALSSWTVGKIMLARDTPLRHKLLEEDYVPSTAEWTSRAEATIKQMNSRCAGLLDVINPPPNPYTVLPLGSYVRFIHRSAMEFLINTNEGRRILQYDTSTEEDRIFNMISAEIALTLGHRDKSRPLIFDAAHVSGWVLIILHRLYRRRRISMARITELMKYDEILFRVGLRSSTTKSSPNLDPLGVAVTDGFLDYVVSAVNSLEASSTAGLLSARYKGYLIATACRGAIRDATDDKVAIVKFLLQKWADADTGRWDFLFSALVPFENVVVPLTPLMKVVKSAFGPHADHNCAYLENMLRHTIRSTLEDVTIMVLEQTSPAFSTVQGQRSDENTADVSHFDGYRISFKCRPECSTLDYASNLCYLVIEANMPYMLDLYLRIQQLQTGSARAQAARRLAAEAAHHSVKKVANVLYGLLVTEHDEYCRSIDLLPCLSDAERSYLPEPLSNISRVEEEGSGPPLLRIPGLYDRMREVAKRDWEFDFKDFFGCIERRGIVRIMHRWGEWAPEPYAS
ncbi:hypothetical protein VTG60DRAFT_6206 [Thermothelomyces hinnuleus]